jgi:hypothetical protein
MAGLAAASLVQSLYDSFERNRPYSMPKKNRVYIPKSQRTYHWHIQNKLAKYIGSKLPKICVDIMITPAQGLLQLLGDPRKRKNAKVKKVRRHTPKRSFRGRVRKNDKTRHSVSKLRKRTLRSSLVDLTSPIAVHVIWDTRAPKETEINSETETQRLQTETRHTRVTKTREQNNCAFPSINRHPEWERNNTDFGTDSFQVKVDNCASRTMSCSRHDFIPGTMRKVSLKGVRGFGNTVTPITHIGTIRWKIYDNDGRLHNIDIPNSYYVPGGSTRLLSPQHWAQQVNDVHPIRHGTWCATHHDSIICYWDQQRYQLTVPVDPKTNNVGTIYTASGFDQAFQAIEESWDTAQDLALESLVLIPEIIPDLYPKGSDDHRLPIEPINYNVPHIIPVDDEQDTKIIEVPKPSSGGEQEDMTLE